MESNKFSILFSSLVSSVLTLPFLINAIINSIQLIWLPLPSDQTVAFLIYLALILNMMCTIAVAMFMVIYTSISLSKRAYSQKGMIKIFLDFVLILVSVSSMIVTKFIEKAHGIDFSFIFNGWAITLIVSVIALVYEFCRYKK